MKKINLFIVFVASIVLTACNSSGEKKTDATPDSTDQASATTEVSKPDIDDPDPTDSIPGGGYIAGTFGKSTESIVRNKLQTIFKDDIEKNILDDISRKFIFYEYDLNDDGKKEIFVGLIGPYFCGTGGCSPYILDNSGEIIAKFSVTDYPIIINTSKSFNWKDLVLISNGKSHAVKFTGITYPSNPSVQPLMTQSPGANFTKALDFVNEPYPWFKF